MIPNNILLYLLSNAVFSPHQRNFFLQQKGKDEENHRQTLHTARVYGTHSSKWDMTIKSLPSKLRESCRRVGGKNQKEWRIPREQDPLTY